jgi:hypothetical protein
VNLVSYRGTRMMTLLPRIRPDNVGLVSIWNDGGKSYLSVWRTVFEQLALASISAVEAALSPVPLGKGNSVVDIGDELLDVLTAAYEEADRTVRTPYLPRWVGQRQILLWFACAPPRAASPREGACIERSRDGQIGRHNCRPRHRRAGPAEITAWITARR